ncbi:O-antigen ligase family protein [Aeromicrobium sp.]|uniref:O-antigen ligase family protein n=1 Tax=Aeromicrobium sp. TaxID=1871063 RepID=UPI0019A6E042|nr:O-antigen ligase family protein [Aeromicrobium sp.]MBC7630450.1 O-antigen ligase family protein [Aeromicrobium sp.]
MTILSVIGLAALAFLAAAFGLLAGPGRAELVLLLPLAMACIALLGVRFPGWTPAVLVLIGALVPYHVSFVGKTPFGVVSVLGAVGALLFAIVLATHRTRISRLRRSPEVLGLLGWIGILAASSLMAGNLKVTLDRTRLVAVAMVGAYLAGRVIARVDSLALSRVVFVVGIVSVLAILEQFTGLSPYDWVPATGFPLEPTGEATRFGLLRVRLGFYHGSVLGTLFAVCIGLIVVRARLTARHTGPWIWLTTVVALFFTLTSQAWLAATAALLVLSLGLRRARGALVVATLIGTVVISSGAVPALSSLVEVRLRPTGSYQDQTDYRLALLPAAIEFANTGPLLGAGPGTFNSLGLTALINNETTLLIDDNTYTAILVEAGYPGLLAFVLALVLVAVRLARRAERWQAWTGLAALAAWMVMGLSVDLLASDQVLMLVWLIFGLLAGYPGRAKPAAEVTTAATTRLGVRA